MNTLQTSATQTRTSIASRIFGNYDPKILWPIAILYLCIISWAIISPDSIAQTFSSIQKFILTQFSWLILLAGASSIGFSLWMALGHLGKVKLGNPDEKPEFSFFAWVSMLFCAALGTGFVIFGTAEPLYHLFQAPTILDAGTAGTARGIPEAIRLSVVNWGLFGWPIFAVGGWAIGYAAYRHNKPLRTSTGLYGLLGARCNDTFISKVVDVLGGIATIGGVSMMIGLGVASITYAFQILLGIHLSTFGKFAVMLCFILIYILSSATGLARGMRYLSESNGYLTIGLLLAVLFLGAAPMTYLFNLTLQTTGEFLFRLPQNILWTDAQNFEAREWTGSWFIFYILWNISYVPFTCVFIARISRGRTMREFVCGTVLTPMAMTLLWFSVWGGTACFTQLKGLLPIWDSVQSNPEQALYTLLGSLPLGTVLCFVAFIVFCLFAITTADAASYFIAQQTTGGTSLPVLSMRVFWGCTIGFTGIIFQVTGGFSAIKSLAIVAASPFVLIVFAYIISIARMMRRDEEASSISTSPAESTPLTL